MHMRACVCACAYAYAHVNLVKAVLLLHADIGSLHCCGLRLGQVGEHIQVILSDGRHGILGLRPGQI